MSQITIDCPYTVFESEWIEVRDLIEKQLREYKNGYYSNLQVKIQE